MGGPMGAYEDERLPWLRAEKRLIADAVRAGTPFWGVCLGAQLLAASLGARVAPGPSPEVGVLPVYRTADADARSGVRVDARRFVALQWHADTFALPDGAVRWRGRTPTSSRRSSFEPRLRGAVPHRGRDDAGRRVGRGARVRREPRGADGRGRDAAAARPGRRGARTR